MALVQNGRYEEAKRVYRETIDKIGVENTEEAREDVFGLWYDPACLAARAGRRDEAFAFLDHSIEAGYTNAKFMRNDEVLKSLRSDARFDRLVARAKAAGPQSASLSK